MTTVVNINFGEKYDVYCGRPSKWSNKWTSKKKGTTLAEFIVETRDEACDSYENWFLNGEGQYLKKHLYELKDKVLGCFCSPMRCHCHFLAKEANKLPEIYSVDKLLEKYKSINQE